MRKYLESELIVNQDGTIFHLGLKPEHIADNVILVGDPDRVELIASNFTDIQCKVKSREFHTISGIYNHKPITVIGTGIGTDNIDIVLNELDALVNIDLNKRVDKIEKKSLTIIRIGTTGAIQADIPPGTFLVSEYALGFDGLINFYAERDKICDLNMESAFVDHMKWNGKLAAPYFCKSNKDLFNTFDEGFMHGITISANGFYGPQGRDLRARLAFPDLNKTLMKFRYEGQRITNYEMEGSAIYGLSKILGHRALTVCLVIANRETKEILGNYKPRMEELILNCLNIISTLQH